MRHWTLSTLAIYSLNGCSFVKVVKPCFATSLNKCECLSERPGVVRMPNKTKQSFKFGIMSAINSTGKRSRADCMGCTALGPICSFGPLVAGTDFFHWKFRAAIRRTHGLSGPKRLRYRNAREISSSQNTTSSYRTHVDSVIQFRI